MAASPVFRLTYNATVDSFPGAVLLMSGVISTILGLLHFYLYAYRDVMNMDEVEDDVPKGKEEAGIPVDEIKVEKTNGNAADSKDSELMASANISN